MLSNLIDTLKHSTIYSLGNLLAKLVGFLLLPIYFHYLTVEEYGIFILLEVTGELFIATLHLNLPVAMMRWYSFSKDETDRKSIIFTSLIFIIAIAIFSSLLLIPLSQFFAKLILSDIYYSQHFSVLFAYVSFSIINRFILNIIRVKQRSGFYVFISFTRFLTILLLNIYFVAYLELGILGILYGFLIGQVVIIFLSIKLVWNSIVFKFNFAALKEMLKYGFPLIFSTLSGMILTLGDRYLLKFFLGEAAVGIYSAGYKIASIINIFINQPFQLGFLPIAFEQAKKDNPQRFFSKILTYKTLLLTLVVIVISFFGGEVIFLITSNADYFKAIPLIPIIAFIFVLKGIQYVISLSFHIVNKTYYNAFIVVSGSILNILLNIFLIPLFGVVGSPISMIISFSMMILAAYYFSQNEYYVPYEIRKIFIMILLAIAFYFIGTEAESLSLLTNIGIKLVCLIAIPFILYGLNFFEKIELERIKEVLKKVK
ncbi:MAG: oligosaccharide flippase family protein [Melioribacteraceae bacterium]|nr:oligosaccharide flippase family protein [Melioribacteraceae bacterium]